MFDLMLPMDNMHVFLAAFICDRPLLAMQEWDSATFAQ